MCIRDRQGAGFALFEESNLIASDFERRVQWQIALEEELCRTITSIEAVEKARVHLVIPEGSVFVREKSEPSASIFLKLNPQASLNDSQIQGILNLVAGSVENLSPNNITIIDSQGNPLFDPYQEPEGQFGFTAAEKQLALTRKFEKEVEMCIRDRSLNIGSMTTAALGVYGINLETSAAAGQAISIVDQAIYMVSSERAKLGAYQNRLEHTIANLGVSSENLTAAESRIRDVDMAEEMMAFTKNQILMQAGTAMLAQANIKPQSVLQLLA